MSISAAKRWFSHASGQYFWHCQHDPTALNPQPCSFFEPLPPTHPFAGFCRWNMAKQGSKNPDDFGDACWSRAAIDAARKEAQP